MAKIDLKNVSVKFPVYNVNARSFKKEFFRVATGGAVAEDEKHHVVVNALKDITVSLQDGDRVGIVGHNGAGKSTLLRLLSQIYEPTSGTITIEGKISPLLSLMHGIEIELTGLDNVINRGTMLGLTRVQIKEKIQEILEFSGLGDYFTMPVRTYSSGMMVRLAFAISTCIKPDILIIDEVFAAGDADFMEKARQRMVSLLEQSSIVVMATHSDLLIQEICNKALLLEGGRVKYLGSVAEVLEMYHHGPRA